MAPSRLKELLNLPSGDRVDLAMALWDSLTEGDRETELTVTEAQRAELDRRWAEHLDHPESAVPWTEVRAKLLD